MPNPEIKALIRSLNFLRENKEISRVIHGAVREILAKIEKMIAEGPYTWDDFEITKDEFDVMKSNYYTAVYKALATGCNEIKELAKKLVIFFKNDEYKDLAEAQEGADNIIKAVDFGLITWEELEITPEDLANALADKK